MKGNGDKSLKYKTEEETGNLKPSNQKDSLVHKKEGQEVTFCFEYLFED